MRSPVRLLREYLTAVQFFTRIPIIGRLAEWVAYSPELLRASAAHFPGIGWLVGVVAAVIYGGLCMALPDTPFTTLVAAVLSTAATAMLTGGFHEDGLADVADGLGGSPDRERALEIMKDSRVGAFGAMALVLALASKISLLALLGSIGLELSTEGADEAPLVLAGGAGCAALFVGHVVSRALPLLLIWAMPHVGDHGGSKSKPLAASISAGSLFIALLWTAGALALALWWLPAEGLLLACGLATLTLWWMKRWFAQRLQGFTGDCLGATQQVCEIAFYLGLALSL
ncbi:MAG: adenosylcobinamide-GDP ribazoletransferase [Pseudomonadota bacterium]